MYEIINKFEKNLNIYLSNLHVRRQDLSLGGTRLPVAIEFYFDADNKVGLNSTEVNPYGNGWTTIYNQILYYDTQGNRYAYKNENGTWIYFVNSNTLTCDGKEIWEEDTTYGIGATGSVLHIQANVEKTQYESVDIISNDIYHSFDGTGRLIRLANNTNQVLISYVSGSQQKIEKITDAVGRQYCFTYSSTSGNGVLTEIICKTASNETITSGNAPISMEYEIENGQLLSVTQSNDDFISYTYDAIGRLTSAANVDDCGFAFAYSGALDIVSTITAKAAMGTALEQSGNVVTVEKTSDNVATITDGNARQEYTFDGCGRMTNCELLTRTYTQAARSMSAQYTCVYGVNMTYGYVTDEDGTITNSVVDVEIYDKDGVIEDSTEETEPTETEPEGTESSNISSTSDAYGNVLSETRTEGTLHQTTTYTYSSDGNYLASKTDENGNTEHYTYNLNNGLLTSFIDGNNNETEYTYDAIRELTNVHLDVGYLLNGTDMEADYSYEKGRLTQLNYGDYHYTFTYDIWGNILTVKMNNKVMVSYDYGDFASKGMVETMTYGNGQEVFYSYNAMDQVASVGYTNQLGRFQYTYSTDGSLASVYDSVTLQTTYYTEDGYEIRNNGNTLLYAYESVDDNSYTETIKGTIFYSDMQEQNDGRSKTKVIQNAQGNNILSANVCYDAFSRLCSKSVNFANINLDQEYTYQTDENGNTKSLVSGYETSYTINEDQTSLLFNYTYDGNGNITGISKSEPSSNEENNNESQSPISPCSIEPWDIPDGVLPDEPRENYSSSYTYDEAGQLIEAVDDETGFIYRYVYDPMGNVQTAQTYITLLNGVERLINEKSFNYNNNGILTSYGAYDIGYSIQVDNMGNPTSIGTDQLTWGEGRMLTEITHSGETSKYTYNSDGLRISKTVIGNTGTVHTDYIWGENGLTAAITDGMIIVVLYDAEGEAVGFSVDGYVYAYVKNLQGDVIRILDQNGEVLVKYTYDPWGVPTVYGDEGLAALNPCSYRGYYYDQETGYYYLQSRYYDPEIGRFLNADNTKLLKEYSNVLGYNLFSYCNNSPISSLDPSGYWVINIKVQTAGFILDAILLLILVIAINIAQFNVIKWIRNVSRAMKNLWNNLVRIISRAIANSTNWIMKKLFSRFTRSSAARLALSATLIAGFINTYISKSPGQILAIIIDKYDRDGKSGYIRF